MTKIPSRWAVRRPSMSGRRRVVRTWTPTSRCIRRAEARVAFNDDRGGRAQGLYSGLNRLTHPLEPTTKGGFSAFSTGDYQIHLELSGGSGPERLKLCAQPQPAPNQPWAASVQVNNGVDAAIATVARLRRRRHRRAAQRRSPQRQHPGRLCDLAALPTITTCACATPG